MQKKLVIGGIITAALVGLLHRGGISFQAHIAWTIITGILLITTAIKNMRTEQSSGVAASGLTLGLLGILIFTTILAWNKSDMADFGIIGITTTINAAGLLFVIWQNNWFTRANIISILKVFSFFAVIITTFGIITYLATPIDRLAGTFAHLPYLITSYPNAYALFIVALLPLALMRASQENSTRTTWTIIAAVEILGILLSFSRGALIAAAIVIAMLITSRMINIKRFVIILAIALIAFGGVQQIKTRVSTNTNSLTEKITMTAGEQTTSTNERLSFWKTAVRRIAEKPMLGFGPDTFSYIAPRDQTELLAASNHPHNLLLKQAVDSGLPSMLALMGIIALALLGGRNIMRNNHDDAEKTAAILTISFVGMLAHNLIDYNLNFVPNAVIFWLLVGSLIASGENVFNKGRAAINPRPLAYISAILGITLLLAGAYETYARAQIVAARSVARQEAVATQTTTATARTTPKTDAPSNGESELLAQTNPIFPEDSALLLPLSLIKQNRLIEASAASARVTDTNAFYAETYALRARIAFAYYQQHRAPNTGAPDKPSTVRAKPTVAPAKTPNNPNLTRAERFMEKAIELDPMNHLDWYYDLIRIKKAANKTLTVDQADTLMKQLQLYKTLLANNAHNTVQTANPRAAIQIAAWYHDTDLAQQLTTIAVTERQKFFNKFYLPLPPL